MTVLSRRDLFRISGTAAAAAALAACDAGGAARRPGPTGFTLTDQRGKRLTFEHPVRRMVTIPMPAAALAIAVDAGPEHLVGMHSSSWTAIHDGIMGQMFPAALKIAHDTASPDFVPNVESVVALNPDVVIQWGDRGGGLTAPLENAGLKVVGLTYGSQRDLTTWITTYGTLFGQRARAAQLNRWMNTQLAQFSRSQSPPPARPPSILYFNRYVGGYKVAGKGTYNDWCAKLVGATNPATGPHGLTGAGMVGVDVEQVLAWDPDVLLLGNFDAAVPADVYRDTVLRDLSAVRSRRVYKVPLGGYRWDPPSQESPLMWRWLSMVAFPDGPAFDLRGQIADDYRLLYDHTPTGEQLDGVLQLAANADSAGVARFRAG